MTQKLVTVEPAATCGHARELMVYHGIRHLPVLSGSRLVGLVSAVDVHNVSAAQAVEGIMSAPVVTLPPTTSVRDAARLMRRRHINCVPVAVDGHLMGILTSADLLEVLGRRREADPAPMSLLWWVAATVLGQAAGMCIAAVYGMFVDGSLAALSVGSAIEAITVGAVQWLALRRLLANIGWRPWLAACSVGGGAGWAAAMLLGGTGVVVAGAAIGLCLGIAQLLVVRKHAARAGWWVLASVLGWIPGVTVMMVGEEVHHGFTGGLASGALVGLATGLALVGMIRASGRAENPSR